MCAKFPKEVPFGKEVHDLLEFYIATNVRPRYVQSQTKLNYKLFCKHIPTPSLTKDILYAFVEQMEERGNVSSRDNLIRTKDGKNVIHIDMPITDWQAASM